MLLASGDGAFVSRGSEDADCTSQCLVQIGEQVTNVFQSGGQTNELWCHPGRTLLIRSELLVSR